AMGIAAARRVELHAGLPGPGTRDRLDDAAPALQAGDRRVARPPRRHPPGRADPPRLLHRRYLPPRRAPAARRRAARRSLVAPRADLCQAYAHDTSKTPVSPASPVTPGHSPPRL